MAQPIHTSVENVVVKIEPSELKKSIRLSITDNWRDGVTQWRSLILYSKDEIRAVSLALLDYLENEEPDPAK